MYKDGVDRLVSASDLVGHLYCRHLTNLELDALEGLIKKPNYSSPVVETLRKRGADHEAAYVAHLQALGYHVQTIPEGKIESHHIAMTQQAMRSGIDVIVQGAFKSGTWVGRTDVLLKTPCPSSLGNWSYEVVDTKLSSETKGGTILQLCLYSEMLAEFQGVMPEHFHVIVPWSEFEPQTFRTSDFLSYHRFVKRLFLSAVKPEDMVDTYPIPDPHCEVCRWSAQCQQKRRLDDHISLVAGVSKRHIQEFGGHGVSSLESLANMPLPISWKPERGSVVSYEKLREQARLQKESRDKGKLSWEPLPIKDGLGLCRLPQPSEGDIFFDLEGDPFVGEGGIEYLFGWAFRNQKSEDIYEARWALSRDEEKRVFEEFIDFAISRWNQFPDFHIYHYAPYEPGALKRLAGRYGTRAEELDRLLRGRRFIDLYAVVRQGLRIGVESYSIKKLEPLYGFTRDVNLPDANIALTRIQADLELGSKSHVQESDKEIVQGYNKDDCVSTLQLRDWLENVRSQLLDDGKNIERPLLLSGDLSDEAQEVQAEIAHLFNALIKDVSVEPSERTPEQNGRWLLAHILEWHRRENKVKWWERYRLNDLSDEEMREENLALSGLVFKEVVPEEPGSRAQVPTHRYAFDPQEFEFKEGLEVFVKGDLKKLGKIVAFDAENGFVDIKKTKETKDIHPYAVIASDPSPSDKVLRESLRRLAADIAAHGIEASLPNRISAQALLMRKMPLNGVELQVGKESVLDAGCRIVKDLKGVLAIQGPPGAGKTFTGARMIVDLLKAKKRVGVTATSHKVIANLLAEVASAAEEDGMSNACFQKVKDIAGTKGVTELKDVDDYVGQPGIVIGSTAWLFAGEKAAGKFDVLFVDEAAQMSLANVLAVTQAAPAIVLLGDPRQLEQPTKATHPDGTGVSALDHILGDAQTIQPDMGLFLEQSWRMHPEICKFISENFYEGRLEPTDEKNLSLQAIAGSNISGSGLRILPVSHAGNQVRSQEEAGAIAELVKSIISNDHTWIDDEGKSHPIGWEDILIVAPFNAQVRLISSLLPEARVGTVDKFQGQEAPIVIYSTTSSSIDDAPRGPEFLYSPNRLNVAISRAKCMSIMVASPAIFEASCRTPRHMQLVNAYCRYQELAVPIALSGS